MNRSVPAITPRDTVCRFAAVVLLSVVLFGCAQPGKRIHAEYDRRISGVRTVGIVAPEISYFDVSFGGVQEKNDESSQLADENVVEAIKAELADRGFEAKKIAREGELKQSLDEIVGLFDTIASSYRIYVLAAGADAFPHKAASFDYSVGAVDEILDACHVDALVLVDGGGRANSFLTTGGTVLLIALVDRTGALLWFEPYAKPSGGIFQRDIRDPEKVRTIVREIFDTLPGERK